MAKTERFDAGRVDSGTKEELEKLDAEIKLLLLPKKTTKGERIEEAYRSLISNLKGEA